MTADIDCFLCRALRGEPAAWSSLPADVSTEAFLRRCAHHGVQPLLHDRMREAADWAGWPPEVRGALERRSKTAVAEDLMRGHRLENLMQRFADEHIRCLLLKGEALAVTHYATPGTRQRCDTDLFIHLGDIEPALRAAAQAGAQIHAPIYKSHQFTVSLAAGQNGFVHFDIHWRLLNNPRYARVLDFDTAYAASIALPGAVPMRALQPVHALLLACLHRMANPRHDRDRLIWLYDIHLLAGELTPRQWRDFASLAVQRNVQAACLDGLRATAGAFEPRITADVTELLETPPARPTLRRRFGDSQLGLLADDWRNLASRTARLGLLRELFLPPGEALLRKYGKQSRWWLPWLYLRQVLGGTFERLTLR